ncbi:MAG: hypothetical protein PHP04_12855 [Bacteroidales bacterium]|nr:hypothetical protein [Bacteroidales bacterium]
MESKNFMMNYIKSGQVCNKELLFLLASMNLKGETPFIFKKLQENPGVVTGWFRYDCVRL